MREYILFECSECKSLVAYPSWTADGRCCSVCKGFIISKNKGTKESLIEMYGDKIIFNKREMVSMKIPEPTCDKCGMVAPIDKEMSTNNWQVYKTKKPCECGGKFKINL